MRPTRSLVHLLNVFAARMEIDCAPAESVKALRLLASDRTIRAAEHRNWTSEQEKRVDRQRNLFVMLPSTNATDCLKDAMLQRAYDLLWDGDALGCDALIEFLPSKDVEKMMDAWSHDFEGADPKSSFHEATQ